MKTLDEIKQLMAAGDTAQADDALKELLAKEPGNLQAKMLYGTCRQLLGDEGTFKRIHDEVEPEMATEEMLFTENETVSLWKRYHALWMSLIVGGLVVVGVGAVTLFGESIKSLVAASTTSAKGSLYGGPEQIKLRRDDFRIDVKSLYAGPPLQEFERSGTGTGIGDAMPQ